MDKENIKETIYRLRKERQLLEVHLLNTGKQMAVWITKQYTYCKKGNCKCTKGYHMGHFIIFFSDKGIK